CTPLKSLLPAGATTRSAGSGLPNLLMTTSASSGATNTRMAVHLKTSHVPYISTSRTITLLIMVEIRVIAPSHSVLNREDAKEREGNREERIFELVSSRPFLALLRDFAVAFRSPCFAHFRTCFASIAGHW